MRTRHFLTISPFLFLPMLAMAAPTPAQKCAFAKIKAAVKATKSRANCYKPVFLKNEALDPACLAKVSEKLAQAFAKAESGGGCPTPNDLAEFQSDVDLCVDGFLTAQPKDCGDTAGPGGGDVPCACGDTVVTDTTLSNDPIATASCPGAGLVLADGVELDLNGLAVTGSGSSNGILVPGGGRVRNGTVQGFSVGIRVTSAPGGSTAIDEVTVQDNGGDGILVELADSVSRVQIVGSHALGNGDDGIHLRGAPGVANLEDMFDNVEEAEYGVTIASTEVADNAQHGVHVGDIDQDADIAARVGGLSEPNDIRANGGAGVVLERATVADACGAFANSGATIMNNRIYDNSGPGVILRSGVIIPLYVPGLIESGLGFVQNEVNHNAMAGIGCDVTQSAPQVLITGPVGYDGAACAAAAGDPEACEDLSDEDGPNHHCVALGGACLVAWDLRGDLQGQCPNGLRNAIFGYNISDPNSPISVGMRAVNNSHVLAGNNLWQHLTSSQNVTQGTGSFVEAEIICGTRGCGS